MTDINPTPIGAPAALADPYRQILTDPHIHCHIPEDELDDFLGYEGYEFESEVQKVADILYEMHDQPGSQSGAFTFGFECNSNREIGSYSVGITLDDGLYLTETHDVKQATQDRFATGEAAAIAIAQALDGDYHRVLNAARKRGLVPASA